MGCHAIVPLNIFEYKHMGYKHDLNTLDSKYCPTPTGSNKKHSRAPLVHLKTPIN
jgi:hypothetical protein